MYVHVDGRSMYRGERLRAVCLPSAIKAASVCAVAALEERSFYCLPAAGVITRARNVSGRLRWSYLRGCKRTWRGCFIMCGCMRVRKMNCGSFLPVFAIFDCVPGCMHFLYYVIYLFFNYLCDSCFVCADIGVNISFFIFLFTY